MLAQIPSLHARISGAIVLVAGCTLLAATALLSWSEYAAAKQQVTARLLAQAELVGNAAAANFLSDDSEAIQRNLDALEKVPEVAQARILGSDGREIARSPHDSNGAENNGDGATVTVKHPIYSGGAQAGSIVITADPRPLHRALWDRLPQVISILIGSLLATCLLAWYMAGFIATPLVNLTHIASAIAAGKDFTAPPQIEIGPGRENAALARAFDTIVQARASREQELQAVEDKAAELSDKLADASRRADMAQAAAGVIHNVGNALSSVTISANVLRERVLLRSKVPLVSQAVAMLREVLDNNVTSPEATHKCRDLLAYLAGATKHLNTVHEHVKVELDSLDAKTEHISSIIAFHQDMSRRGVAVNEHANLEHVVDVAISLGEGALSDNSIELRRQYANVGIVRLDRNKAVQILVNLINNARHSLRECTREDKCMWIGTAQEQDGSFQVAVSDNGLGIESSVLEQLFQHGFTTRDDGHGFGLHASANLAKEMGGQITAASDGPGHGATFTLKIAPQSTSGELPTATDLEETG